MRAPTLAIACALTVWSAVPIGAETRSPEDTVRQYLGALKERRLADAYRLVSSAMRGGKSEEVWVKEQRAGMDVAEVKILEFTVYPGKIEGSVAHVPNVLSAQDRYLNQLGLTEYELYTLVREEGAWKVDSQLIVETPDIPKWFPKRDADRPEVPPTPASD